MRVPGVISLVLLFALLKSATKEITEAHTVTHWASLYQTGIWTTPIADSLLAFLVTAGPFAARTPLALTVMGQAGAASGTRRRRNEPPAAEVHAFRYARPLTCAALTVSGFRVAALGVAEAAVFCLPVAVIWLCCPAMDAAGRRAPLGVLLGGLIAADPSLAILIAVVVAVLALTTWSGQILRVAMDHDRMTSRHAGVVVLEFVYLAAAGALVLMRAFAHPHQGMNGAVFSALLYVTFVVRAAAAAILAFQAMRAHLLSKRTVAVIRCCWLLTIGILTFALCMALPTSTWSTVQIACSLALFVPLVRVYAAPLLIARDRHR
jgi:hypothetical protein